MAPERLQLNRLTTALMLSLGLHVVVLQAGVMPKMNGPELSVNRGRSSVRVSLKPTTAEKTKREQPKDQSKPEPEASQPEPESPPAPESETAADSATDQSRTSDDPEKQSSPDEAPVSDPSPGARMVKPAEYRRNPSPEYPMISRRRGEQGVVILRVEVDPRGNPLSVKVEEGSGYRRLDREAIETVEHWSFSPASENGRPVKSAVRVPVRFRIE